jgi:multiple sugar transport system substrate-binding protein
LKFWQFYGPGGGVATQDKWFVDVAKSWNDSHEVKVELVYVPNNAYMDGTKLPTAFASGSGPDLFIISPGDFLRYYNGGVLLDLTPFMEQAARDDFFPSVIANRMVDGKIYGLPYEVEPMAMYYSVDAFNEIGLTDKDVPKTWDELLSVAKKLTNAKRYGVLFETSPGYYQNFTWYPFLWEAGGDFQTKEGKSAFNSPATVQALKFWQDSINMGDCAA